MRRALVVLILLTLGPAIGAGAQELRDRIIAIVDKDPIFLSDLEGAVAEETYVRKMRGEAVPSDSAGLAAMREDLLESLIDRRIVIAKAKKESVEVTPTEVEDGLDQWLGDLAKSAGSEAAFNQELVRQGVTVGDLKDRYRKEIGEQLLVSKVMRKQFGAITVSENDLSKFYQDKYDSVPSLPEMVGIAHILISPQITPAKEAEVAAKVTRVQDRLKRGEPFEKVAREMSDDPATRDGGGDIGMMPLADLQTDIAATAGNMSVGQVSDPFRTAYGVEILKLEGKTGDSYRLRHIFVRFAPDAQDSAKALKLVTEIRSRLTAGESFESLARQHSDDGTTKENGGSLGEVEAGGLDPTFADAIAALNPGDISPVISTPHGFEILKLISRTAARKPSYDEAKPWIKNLLESRQREEEFTKWLDAARHEIYVKKLP